MNYVAEVIARFSGYRQREQEKLAEQEYALAETLRRNEGYANDSMLNMSQRWAKLRGMTDAP